MTGKMKTPAGNLNPAGVFIMRFLDNECRDIFIDFHGYRVKSTGPNILGLVTVISLRFEKLSSKQIYDS